jgi:hypothetical protein
MSDGEECHDCSNSTLMWDKTVTKPKGDPEVPVSTVAKRDTSLETVNNPNKQEPTMDGRQEVCQNKHQ